MKQKPGQSRPLWEAREYERYYSQFIDDADRPLFHLSPLVGWMNDPNGFSYHDGLYHLFYQYNPYKTQWAPMHWGHAVSEDLLTWKYLPTALAPDMPYDDKDGCFSGSAVFLPDGRHLLMYTGVATGGHLADGTVAERQTQCLAIGDGVDYVKWPANPVIGPDDIPSDIDTRHFRDPKMWLEEDGTYRCVAAALGAPEKSGRILLFSSADGFEWHYERTLLRNDGRYGVMWECPDFFELDGYSVLLVSPQDMIPVRHDFHCGNNVICFLGHTDKETGEFVEESCATVDHGIDFYATQTLLAPDGRRIMVAWMQNWDTITANTKEDRWFGQMNIPRELSVRNGGLCQWPIRELESYRCNRVAYENVALNDVLSLDGVSGRCVDLLLNIRPVDPENPYHQFVLRFAEDGQFYTSLRFKPAKGEFKIDRTRSGSRRALLHHRKCVIGRYTDELKLRVVLDRHSAEIFINGGTHVMSVTLPTNEDADGITFCADGNAVIDVEKFDLSRTTETVCS